MDAHIIEWLNLLLRWMHIIAGIAWIGSSFYFMWLDSHIQPPKENKKDVVGELWMVHSGGFYLVEKRLLSPGELPELHWFKWEAALTWISGFFLLSVVYYMTGGIYLLDPAVSNISVGAATGIGIGLLIVSLAVYDTIWKSPLGKFPKLTSAICFLLVVGIAYGLNHIYSGRATFLHIGAMFGTLMAANVWMRILPAQSKMIEATRKGEKVDYSFGEQAKLRSVHNNYMTFPLLFMMLSNHFPSTYGNQYSWLVLTGLILAGAGVRHFMNVKNKFSGIVLTASAATIVALFFMTSPKQTNTADASLVNSSDNAVTDKVTFTQAREVITKRCTTCHSAKPTDDIFSVAPVGVMFDTSEQIKMRIDRIRDRVVINRTMPLGNKTKITEEERQLLGKWIEQGANIK